MATITNVYEFRGMNADDMKLSYKRLVRKLHPDVSGYDSTRDMQILNGEFAYWYSIAARDFVYQSKVAEKPESKDYYHRTYNNDTFIHDLSSAIEWLLNNGIYTRGDLTVELVGTFIWVMGVDRDMKADQELLKSRQFRFKMKIDTDTNERIAAWYYTPNFVSIHSDTSIQANRKYYGSSKIYNNKASLSSGD